MTIEQLRADYAECKNYFGAPPALRIIAAMPAILDILEKAIAWQDDNGAYYTHQALRKAIDAFID